MALSFGWKANDLRESIWIDDPAIPRTADGKPAVPQGALDAWREDGDASHLEPYANGQATIIRFRALTPDEKPIVTGIASVTDNQVERSDRALLRCFRMGVSFDGMDETAAGPGGERRRLTVKENGVRMLALEFVDDLTDKYPGIVYFYGGLVFGASFMTEVEKKASSQPSTPTPSSAEVSTADTTAPSPPPEAAKAAP